MSFWLAEFESAESCKTALVELRKRGFRKLEVFMPYPEKSIQKELGLGRSPLPWFVFGAGLTGACLAYFILWYTTAVDYPLDVGGRPDHAVPAFIPITFETTVLFAGTTAFVLGLVLSGLPRFWTPVFEIGAIERSMVDGWFIQIDDTDPKLDEESLSKQAKSLFQSLGAARVHRPDDPDGVRRESTAEGREHD